MSLCVTCLFINIYVAMVLPWRLSAQRICLQCRGPPAMQEMQCNAWVGKIPWRRKWLPTPVVLPGKSHGQRSLAGHSPWGHQESDVSEQLNTLRCYSYRVSAFVIKYVHKKSKLQKMKSRNRIQVSSSQNSLRIILASLRCMFTHVRDCYSQIWDVLMAQTEKNPPAM